MLWASHNILPDSCLHPSKDPSIATPRWISLHTPICVKFNATCRGKHPVNHSYISLRFTIISLSKGKINFRSNIFGFSPSFFRPLRLLLYHFFMPSLPNMPKTRSKQLVPTDLFKDNFTFSNKIFMKQGLHRFLLLILPLILPNKFFNTLVLLTRPLIKWSVFSSWPLHFSQVRDKHMFRVYLNLFDMILSWVLTKWIG